MAKTKRGQAGVNLHRPTQIWSAEDAAEARRSAAATAAPHRRTCEASCDNSAGNRGSHSSIFQLGVSTFCGVCWVNCPGFR
jgi:hypothetical protein